MQNEQLDITPTVGLLALLKNMRYTEWYALGEFVDNAIQSYRLNKKVLKKLDPLFKLKIKIDILGSEIQIKDNAAGIGHDRYAAAFETGKPPPDSTGLSEFGVGMKIAACWFADKWKVHTKAIGETAYRLVEFDINKIREKNITNLDVIRAPAKLNSHYTIVTLSKLNHKPRSLTITKIKEHLGSMYRHLVNSNEIDIIVDNKSLRYEKPTIRTSGYYKHWEDGIIKKKDIKKIKWYKEFSFDFENMPITGFVAIREKGKVKQPGFSLFRRGRLITGTEDNPFKPERIFGQGNDRRQQVIFGEIHMDDMPVAFSKNDFVWDETKKNKFISKLHEVTQFIDKQKKIDFIQQSKHWSENLERDDIRAESKNDLETVKKFITKGLEQAKIETAKIIPLSKKHTVADEYDSIDEYDVPFLGVVYKIQVVNEYSNNVDLYDIQLVGEKTVKIFLNLKHPFSSRFFTARNERMGFSILIAYLACCEVHITKKEGVKDASLIRFRLNEICQNIPPKT